jgi:hypothetical protein
MKRRGGYSKGPYTDGVAARDADPEYSYPKRREVPGEVSPGSANAESREVGPPDPDGDL